jgi:hypothetical protein
MPRLLRFRPERGLDAGRPNSTFAATMAPQQLVVRIEHTGKRLAARRVTTDPGGQHLVYREYDLDRNRRSVVDAARSAPLSNALPMESAGGRAVNERWQVSRGGRLTIRGPSSEVPELSINRWC